MSTDGNKTPTILAAAAEASAPATTGYEPPPAYWPQPYSYAPPPAYQQHPYWYAPPQQSTNGFAIASLVLGILGIFFITLPLSAVFGFIALSQTKHGRQGGRGMAITGLVLSGIWFLIFFVPFLWGFVQGASEASPS